MKLALVLARAGALAWARPLCAAALRAGDEVAWFAMDEALVELLALDAAAEPWLDDLEVTVCATSLDRLGAAPPSWARLGSQDDHAALLRWADRTVALT